MVILSIAREKDGGWLCDWEMFFEEIEQQKKLSASPYTSYGFDQSFMFLANQKVQATFFLIPMQHISYCVFRGLL